MVCMHCENWEIARIFDKRLKSRPDRLGNLVGTARPLPRGLAHPCWYGDMAAEIGCPIYIQHSTTPSPARRSSSCGAAGSDLRPDRPALAPLRQGRAQRLADQRAAPFAGEQPEHLDRASAGSSARSAPPRRRLGACHYSSYNENIWELKTGFTSRVEMHLPVLLEGVHQGKLTIERLVEVACANPARIFGVYPRRA